MKNRKINKVKVGIVLIIFLILLINLTGMARIVYNNVKDRYLTSKEFYFSSNLLDVNAPSYTYKNWSGNDVYRLDIELYSFENNLLRYDENLTYKISATTTSSKINCAIGTQSGSSTGTGVIDADTNEKVVSIYLIPKSDISIGENISITVTAFTEEPYSKTISGKFDFQITAIGADYQIEDKEYQNYALVKLKNTFSIDTEVTIEFDPSVVRLDMNDEIYLDSSIYKSHVTKTMNGANYIYKITFLMPKESSKNIKFYKVDKSQNYTNALDTFKITKEESETVTPSS